MSEPPPEAGWPAPFLATRVPVSTLLNRPAEARVQRPPSPDRLLAERASGEAAARDELLPLIGTLQAELEAAEIRHAAGLQETRDLALRLTAALERLMAAELAELAHALAATVLEAEPVIQVETLRALVADAVSGLPGGKLCVPADALEAARGLCPDGWELEARPGLAPGTVEAVAGPALQRQTLSARLCALMGERGA